jgi:hypothetical protein
MREDVVGQGGAGRGGVSHAKERERGVMSGNKGVGGLVHGGDS